MARYVAHIRTPMSPDDAFAYMADLRNFAEWDPGVTEVSQVTGEGEGPNSVFDVDVKSVGGTMTLRYETTAYDAPNKIVAVAESTLLKSTDTITIRSEDTGSVVTYDAVLELRGPLGLADPLLAKAFDKIGDRAADGMVEALNGEKVS